MVIVGSVLILYTYVQVPILTWAIVSISTVVVITSANKSSNCVRTIGILVTLARSSTFINICVFKNHLSVRTASPDCTGNVFFYDFT